MVLVSLLMSKISQIKKWRDFQNGILTEKLNFFDLIKPKVSFDFLGGMFLSVFRKKNWDKYQNILCEEALESQNTFSHFDNTFPHLKIFASAFSHSSAYFNSLPMNICLTGARVGSNGASSKEYKTN